jgi:hypothetical protein
VTARRKKPAFPKASRSKASRSKGPRAAAAKKKIPATGGHPVRKHSASDQRLIERVRKLCMKLPEANEKISHGEPTFFAGKGKVFAMIDGHHHNSQHLSVWLPQPFGAQEALIDADAERFFRPGLWNWCGTCVGITPCGSGN